MRHGGCDGAATGQQCSVNNSTANGRVTRRQLTDDSRQHQISRNAVNGYANWPAANAELTSRKVSLREITTLQAVAQSNRNGFAFCRERRLDPYKRNLVPLDLSAVAGPCPRRGSWQAFAAALG